MYNYFLLVGFVKEILSKDLKNGRKKTRVVLKVRRDFKDVEGNYVYDLIEVSTYDFLAEMVLEKIKIGDRIGFKGRATSDNGLELVADKAIWFDCCNKEEE